MTKLIATYRRLPTPTNRRRLQAYIANHPASWVLASEAERDFLTANQFEVPA
jgi:hypothetical protein